MFQFYKQKYKKNLISEDLRKVAQILIDTFSYKYMDSYHYGLNYLFMTKCEIMSEKFGLVLAISVSENLDTVSRHW